MSDKQGSANVPGKDELKDLKPEKKDETAYEKKAQDSAGRDWTKRKSFKPEGGV